LVGGQTQDLRYVPIPAAGAFDPADEGARDRVAALVLSERRMIKRMLEKAPREPGLG
jgi:hypothetical protein